MLTIRAFSVTCAVLCLGFAGCPEWWWQGGPYPPLPEAGSSGPTPVDAGAAEPAEPVSEPVLPNVDGSCPTITTGTVTLRGVELKLWLGDAPAGAQIPILVYWHGTGSTASEAEFTQPEQFADFLAEGGLVVSLEGTTGEGTNTSTGTWSTGDFAIVDQVIACAAEQLPVDARRIYTTGCSSGAVHAGVMAYQRSRYIAAAALNSGGQVQPFDLQEPGHVPSVILAHGPSGTDVVIIDFAQASTLYAQDLARAGGVAVECGHALGHCAAPAELKRAMFQFLADHTFAVEPKPYAGGLPDSFPDYCKIIE